MFSIVHRNAYNSVYNVDCLLLWFLMTIRCIRQMMSSNIYPHPLKVEVEVHIHIYKNHSDFSKSKYYEEVDELGILTQAVSKLEHLKKI